MTSDGDAEKPVNYIFKWYLDNTSRNLWFIRGIRPDGTFYGETMSEGNGSKLANVSGVLATSDYDRFLSLVASAKLDEKRDAEEKKWRGLIAEGPINSPKRIALYDPNVDRGTELEACFLRIVELLTPYMQSNN